MGLTVHFQLRAPADTATADAKRLVLAAHRVARRFQREGWAERVGPVSDAPGLLERVACDWLILPVPSEPNTSTGAELLPLGGWVFRVDMGADCEPLWLGLCRYPAKVRHGGRELPTGKGRGWRLPGFIKTQYASLHGVEHFLRCHRGAVELLAGLRPLGFRVKITDEGGYWPRRSIASLRSEVDQMNRLVAAMAGGLKDGADAKVESPIFQHKEFERLEAEGGEVWTRAKPIIEAELGRLRKTDEGKKPR
jgi:hypothetical protein